MNIKNEFLILEFVKLFYSKMFTFYKASVVYNRNTKTDLLHRYFVLYDKDRSQLTAAYDANCMFSMCVDPYQRGQNFNKFVNHSRNLMKLKGGKSKFSILQRNSVKV